MKRVLITGATGFIGGHALRHLLDRNFEVHAVARRPGEPHARLTWHTADLLDPGMATKLVYAARPQALLHLAWNATPGKFWTASDNLGWVASTLELHRAFSEAGGERAVYAGTCAEYDWAHSELDERKTPLIPRTLYGIAKEATARLVLAADENGTPSVAWGRIFFLYGPGEARGRLVSDVVTGLLAGRRVDCTEGTQERDFMHVEDVARAFIAVLESDYSGPVNIASGECRRIRDVIEEIAKQIGRPELVRFGARAMPPNDPARLAANSSLLHERIGFQPKFGFTEGMGDTINWWRARSR